MKLPARLSSVSLWLRISAVLTLFALALMVWSVLEPTPLPVMLAMTIGQGLGTAAFGIFGFIVFKDLTRTRRAKRDSLQLIGSSERRAGRDSLQNIALTSEPATDEPAKSRDSLQNIGLSKDEP
ncbi:MAG TPA: hypothetical protein VIV40_41490 [Kofleriaceae bacterium]